MKHKLPNMSKYAVRFGKHDMERLGLFIEMPYMPVRVKPSAKDKEKEMKAKKAEAEDEINGPMLPAGPTVPKSGTMDGYFDDEFKRIFKGEYGSKGKKKKPKKKADDGKLAFIPAGPSKTHATPGDFFGTFGPVLSEFSPTKRKKPKFVHEKPNPVTNPGKKGGPGYIDITLGKYPEYIGGMPRKQKKPIKPRAGPLVSAHYTSDYFYPNPYIDPLMPIPNKRLYNPPKEKIDKKALRKLFGRPTFMPTGPGKWEGGCKGGTFTKWPVWEKDRWLSPVEKERALAGEWVPYLDGDFFPQSWGYKSMNTVSTLYKTNFSMNNTNWKVYEPTWIKRLVKSIY